MSPGTMRTRTIAGHGKMLWPVQDDKAPNNYGTFFLCMKTCSWEKKSRGGLIKLSDPCHVGYLDDPGETAMGLCLCSVLILNVRPNRAYVAGSVVYPNVFRSSFCGAEKSDG
ncbi:hypothetical protein VPH35_075690 [Triticum aestivum]